MRFDHPRRLHRKERTILGPRIISSQGLPWLVFLGAKSTWLTEPSSLYTFPKRKPLGIYKIDATLHKDFVYRSEAQKVYEEDKDLVLIRTQNMNLCFTPPPSVTGEVSAAIPQRTEPPPAAPQLSAGVHDAFAALAQKFAPPAGADGDKPEPEILCGFGGSKLAKKEPSPPLEEPEILCGFGGSKLAKADVDVVQSPSAKVLDAFAALANKFPSASMEENVEEPTPTYEAKCAQSNVEFLNEPNDSPMFAGLGGRDGSGGLNTASQKKATFAQDNAKVASPKILAVGVPKKAGEGGGENERNTRMSRLDMKLDKELMNLKSQQSTKPKKAKLHVEFNPNLVLKTEDVQGGSEVEILCGVGLGKLNPVKEPEPVTSRLERTTSAGNLQMLVEAKRTPMEAEMPRERKGSVSTIEQLRKEAQMRRARSHQNLAELAEGSEQSEESKPAEASILCGFGGLKVNAGDSGAQYFGFAGSKPAAPRTKEEDAEVQLLAGFGMRGKPEKTEKSPELLAGFGGVRRAEKSPEVLAGFGGLAGRKKVDKGKKKVDTEVVYGFGGDQGLQTDREEKPERTEFFHLSQSTTVQHTRAQSQLAADLLKAAPAQKSEDDGLACKNEKLSDELAFLEEDNTNLIPPRPLFDPLRSGEDLFGVSDDEDEGKGKRARSRSDDMRTYVRVNDSEQVVAKMTFLMDDNEKMAKRNDELEEQLAGAAMTRERSQQNTDRLRTFLGDIRTATQRASQQRRNLNRTSFEAIRSDERRPMSVSEMSSVSGNRIEQVTADLNEWERSLLSQRENPLHEDEYLPEDIRELKLIGNDTAMVLVDLLKENARLKQEMNEMSEHLTTVTEEKNRLFLQQFNQSNNNAGEGSSRTPQRVSVDESCSTPNQQAVLPVGVVIQEEEPSTHLRYFEGVTTSAGSFSASGSPVSTAADSRRAQMLDRPARPLRLRSDTGMVHRSREESRYSNPTENIGDDAVTPGAAVNQFQDGQNIYVPLYK